MLYFAGVRDLVGHPEEQLELPRDVGTVGELREHLQRLHPTLQGQLDGVRFALNESFVDLAAALGNEDVVAVIPPVAGG